MVPELYIRYQRLVRTENRVCLANRIIELHGELSRPVKEEGIFVVPWMHFAGRGVEEADKSYLSGTEQRRLGKNKSPNCRYLLRWRPDAPVV